MNFPNFFSIRIKKFNRKVHVFYGEAAEVFEELTSQFHLSTVFSYQESGIRNTWNRDKEIRKIRNTKNC